MSPHIVTCTTFGCANAEIPIEVPDCTVIDGEIFPTSIVICGPCGTPLPIPTDNPESPAQ